MDEEALRSLTLLTYEGPLCLAIHDDSLDSVQQAAVDAMARELSRARRWQVLVLRRPDKTGGKPGAVNYVLAETGHRFEYFLLCDNDSTVVSPDCVERSLPYLDSRDIAVVQCRTVHVNDPQYCATNRFLAPAISAFHAFLLPASRFGWMPFVGHNAFLRTSAVRKVGGLTPGFFSDDLDLTVRLNLEGFRVAYAPDIAMGEKHPPSYTAFRKRSYKWAYGCIQTLRAHSRHVLTSRRFTFAEKLSFFQFTGFYCIQCLLLAYLAFALLALPLGVLGEFSPRPMPSVLIGTLLVLLVYAPLISYHIKQRRRARGWALSLALCGLVYGGTDFTVCRGVADALIRRKRPWIPTNGVAAETVEPVLFGEAAFGLLLLIVPLAYFPELLFLPCWYLFAGKFLFGPGLSLLYQDGNHEDTSRDAEHARRNVIAVPAESRVDAINP